MGNSSSQPTSAQHVFTAYGSAEQGQHNISLTSRQRPSCPTLRRPCKHVTEQPRSEQPSFRRRYGPYLTRNQTDSTRAKNLELIIQQRVTSELQKHLAQAESKLASLSDSLSSEPISSGSSSGPSLTEKPLLNRLTDALTGNNSTPEAPSSDSKSTGLDRNAVAKDLEELRKKLNARKKIAEKDAGVEKAKEEVIACLKVNDRRPLDCWQEVEKFKAEVGRLERSFVDRNAA